MSEVIRPYRGVSAEDRRDDRRTRLLAAGLDTVGAVGVTDLTVDAVCTRAGLSKRYFYESFADRDALLTAALDGVFVDIRQAIVTELASAGDAMHDRATGTVEAITRTFELDPRAARLYVEAAGHPALRSRRDAAVDEFSALVLESVFGVRTGDETTRLVAIVVVAGTMEAIGRWIADDIDLTREQLVAAIGGIGVAISGLLPS